MQKKLRDIYEAMGFASQAEMAHYFGVSQGTMSRWLSGGHDPKGEVRDRINRLYDQLFGVSQPHEIDEDFRTLYQRILRLPLPQRRLFLLMAQAALEALIAYFRNQNRLPKR
jgi:transcriptional regulator with XRE-family HTH domain